MRLSADQCVPRDAAALLIGRAWVPAEDGPSVIAVRGDEAVDLTPSYETVSQFLNIAKLDELRAAIKVAPAIGRLDDLVANSREGQRDLSRPWLLAPCDLQAVKASGVTFVASPRFPGNGPA
jgi:fumarylacetoacetate (FAA) hydrolase family protein